VPVMVHVSHPYVTVGLIIDLYICSLLAELRSLFFSSFLFANQLHTQTQCKHKNTRKLTQTHTNAHKHKNTPQIHKHTKTRANTKTHTNAHKHTQTQKHPTNTQTPTQTPTQTHTNTHIHTQTQIHTNTRTHCFGIVKAMRWAVEFGHLLNYSVARTKKCLAWCVFSVNIVACLINCSHKNGHLLVGRAIKKESGSSRDKKRPGRPQPKGMWAYMPKTARDCEDNSSRGVNKLLLLAAQILQRLKSQKNITLLYISYVLNSS
jgi:hypothetical protein